MKDRKKILTRVGAAALAIALLAATWAYFTSTSSIKNEMQTKSYGSKTVETFTPKQDMEPGKEIEKKVGVTNTGDYDLVVRVKMDEKWTFASGDPKEIAYNGKIDTVVYDAGPPESWTAKQTSDTDGNVDRTDAEETVVYKKMNLGSDWKKGSDGYFYYTVQLKAGQPTAANLLESIVLASNTDIGVYKSTVYYSTANKATIEQKIADGTITEADYGWVTAKPSDESKITFVKNETELEQGKEGYAKADYALTITTEVCQATQEAVDAEWGMAAPDLLAIKTAWALQ